MTVKIIDLTGFTLADYSQTLLPFIIGTTSLSRSEHNYSQWFDWQHVATGFGLVEQKYFFL